MFYKKVPNPIHGRLSRSIFSTSDSERSKFLEHNYYNKKDLEIIKSKLNYNIMLLRIKLWEQREITDLDHYKKIQDGIKKLMNAYESCIDQLIINSKLRQKYGPLIPGHTTESIKRSKVGPRTKFQRDCDWLNAELRRINATGEVSPIKEIDGIFQVSKFAVEKIINMSIHPIKLHAIWLAGWIIEASFIRKDKNPEYKYFLDRYRIPHIFDHNNNYNLHPNLLISFLPIQIMDSYQLQQISKYFYKCLLDFDVWLSKISFMAGMSHNIFPIIGKFPEPYFMIFKEAEDKAFKYLDAKFTNEQLKRQSKVNQ